MENELLAYVVKKECEFKNKNEEVVKYTGYFIAIPELKMFERVEMPKDALAKDLKKEFLEKVAINYEDYQKAMKGE